MVKVNVEMDINAYELDPKEGKDEVDSGLEIKMVYEDKISGTIELPYAHAVYLMRSLPKNNPIKEKMYKELKKLPRPI